MSTTTWSLPTWMTLPLTMSPSLTSSCLRDSSNSAAKLSSCELLLSVCAETMRLILCLPGPHEGPSADVPRVAGVRVSPGRAPTIRRAQGQMKARNLASGLGNVNASGPRAGAAGSRWGGRARKAPGPAAAAAAARPLFGHLRGHDLGHDGRHFGHHLVRTERAGVDLDGLVRPPQRRRRAGR